jgi:hypothetical protein
MAVAELRVSLRDSFLSLFAAVALLVLGILLAATSDSVVRQRFGWPRASAAWLHRCGYFKSIAP